MLFEAIVPYLLAGTAFVLIGGRFNKEDDEPSVSSLFAYMAGGAMLGMALKAAM